MTDQLNKFYHVVVQRNKIEEAILEISAPNLKAARDRAINLGWEDEDIKYEPFTTKFKIVEVHDFDEYNKITPGE